MNGSRVKPWWQDGVVYQVYPRSFFDSSGDGIGDLLGIELKLDYIQSLGVTAIWLSPFYPSPGADQGYDVSDYVGVAPEYGTVAGFDSLISAAHARGLRIIIDIVANHCSVAHPLFQAALAAGRGSAERDRFHFSEGTGPNGESPPNNWRSMFGGSAWTQVADGQWYLHLFTDAQPDFNWRNPSTIGFFDDVLMTWMDRGVDGFRIDAAQGLFKQRGLPDTADPGAEERIADATTPEAWDQPETHQVYKHWRELVDARNAEDGVERVLVGEVTGIGQRNLAAYVGPDRMHQAFFFDFLRMSWDADSIRAAVERGLTVEQETQSPTTWVLGNHDSTRIATRFGGGGADVASQGDVARGALIARSAALFALALPGSAYVYQGEELGLREVVDIPDHLLRDPIFRRTQGARRGRDGCRVPLPWSGLSAPFGFSAGADTWLPQPAWFSDFTVERELQEPGSSLNLYLNALQLRKLLPDEDFAWLAGLPEGVLGFTRGPNFTCIVNVTSSSAPVPDSGTIVLGSTPENGLIPAYSTLWFAPTGMASAWLNHTTTTPRKEAIV